jgi:hypothetical protein
VSTDNLECPSASRWRGNTAPLVHAATWSTVDPSAPPDPHAVDPVHRISHWKLNLGNSIFLAFCE